MDSALSAADLDVVFVVMPFADVGRPAIGVSLLKAAALRAGYTATIRYCNIQLAAAMGGELYQRVSNSFAPDLLVGEWFFADDLFGDDIPVEEDYLEQVLARFAGPDTIDALRRVRAGRRSYLDDAAGQIAKLGPKIVGFTSTFHQTCSSLAVARRLKDLPNPPLIVFGGANCEGEMGLQLLQSFPWIDYVCQGEADVSFVGLLDHVFRDASAVPSGVIRRCGAASPKRSEVVRDLDQLPYPDYDDYFEQLRQSHVEGTVPMCVVAETSRGCWWGAKHHCTFCGLNGETMVFRSKSPERAFDEITWLAREHGVSRIGCVDNILDMRYIDTLFPKLAASGLELDLFYEVKANLRLDQLVTMHAGGMRQIQPGVESFSNQVLRLMQKGVTAFQNIQLLRWCKEIGIECAWNLLAGFPNEPPLEYSRMAELIPLLTHLDPPCSAAQVRLDRFSPFHARADEFGFRKMRPARAYFFVFPLGRRELSRLAYFFDFDYDDGRDPSSYLQPVQLAVQRWWDSRSPARTPPRLDARFEDEAVLISDTREVARAGEHRLTGLPARLVTLCDCAATVPALLRQPDLSGREEGVRAALETLLEDRLVVCDGDHYLSLPVFLNRPGGLSPRRRDAAHTVSQAAPAEPLLRVV